ncbi:hypothetical protein [Joostella sp.]|uniref:hypothetical protein n=1 Tax=Joostella sp. TaxID=2231138 RepID=UPI003A8FDCA8
MKKREFLVRWEHFCRWFRKINGFYILIAIITTTNVFSWLEKADLQVKNNTLNDKLEMLQGSYDKLSAKYLIEARRYSRIDSFTNNAGKRYLDLLEQNNELSKSISQKLDTLNIIRRQIKKQDNELKDEANINK